MKPTLSLDRFNAMIEDRNFHKAREMYRELIHDLTTAEDALAVTVAKRKAHQAFQPEISDAEFPTYAVTSGGKLWKWNCGWQQFDKSGKHIGTPIGHVEFRRKPLGKKTDPWVRLSRPEGTWRRYIDCILNHPLFGNGKVICTDGHHALFEFTTADGTLRKEEVIFHSLNEIAVATPRKASGVKPITKPRELKISDIALDLL